MLNYIKGTVKKYRQKTYIQNDFIGVEGFYFGEQKKGEFFLFPYIDDNKKTIIYFIFDSIEQKITFEDVLKINGVGTKTAFQIVQIPKDKIDTAIKTLDTKFFQSIPGIGPKSAKKILLEMKGNFEIEDVQKIEIDQKLYKNIINSLKGFGYDASSIKNILQQYDGKITKENMPEVIKRVISQI